MRRWWRGGLSVALGFSLTLVATQLQERSRPSTKRDGADLGGIDFDEYCRTHYGDRSSAVHVGATAYGWECWSKKNELLVASQIPVDDACSSQYRTVAYASVTDLNTSTGWACIKGARSATSP